MSYNQASRPLQMDIGKTVKEISRIENFVRDHIRTHRYQADLLKNSQTWNQICSSLDVIGDSLDAIDAFSSEPYPEDVGLKYIFTYGVLQALFIQQDGLRHLTEAFGLEFQISPALSKIREIRNASIGHPTKQDQKGNRYYNYISRISLYKGGFDLLRHSEDRPYEIVHVDITSAISEQLSSVLDGYGKVAHWLAEVDRMHKEKYRASPLVDVFPDAMGYFFEKIGEGIHDRSHGRLAFSHANVRIVKEVYEKFQTALAERNELSEYTLYDLCEYFHALSRLSSYLSSEPTHMEEADARIYHTYLHSEHKQFFALAKEIDARYQERDTTPDIAK